MKKSLIVDATMENLDRVIGFVEGMLEEAMCPVKICMQISVSLEEIYVNVVNYAYGDKVGMCEIEAELLEEDDSREISIVIIDSGKEFNPLAKEDPDITLSAEERKIGGLGIYMVKKSMDEVVYEYTSGQNRLMMKKKW